MMIHIGTALSYLPIVAQAREAARSEFRDRAHYQLCVKSRARPPTAQKIRTIGWPSLKESKPSDRYTILLRWTDGSTIDLVSFGAYHSGRVILGGYAWLQDTHIDATWGCPLELGREVLRQAHQILSQCDSPAVEWSAPVQQDT